MTCQNDEASEHREELMEVDISNSNNGCVREIRENGLLLWPVPPKKYGEGLPYAPVNWPSPGDIWGWRVGKRIAASGFYLDRYLYLPPRFQKSRHKRDGFGSRLAVERYVQSIVPGVDVNTFFSSFSWKIPSKQAYLSKDEHDSNVPSEETVEQSPDSLSGTAVCKAGNRFCSSLSEEEMSSSAATQSCDVCCTESSFCRQCCCILCCKTVDLAFEGYSFIRCRATAQTSLICGHAAHINCALRSYMAGTVGGSVGLDTEYYCRRCDTRTDLTEHVRKLLETCESVESHDDVVKMLNIGACLLRGSQKRGSQRLLNRIESAFQKLKDGSNLDDIWKTEIGVTPGKWDDVNNQPSETEEDNLSFENKHEKLEEEIDQVLRELRKSQEVEYRIAKEKLHAQKDCLFRLSEQVNEKKHELKTRTQPADHNALRSSIKLKEERMRCELRKLRDMEKISKGFGKAPKDILKEHFDVHVDDEDRNPCNSL